MNHPQFHKGDPVRTKIVYGRGSQSNIWVEATIEGYHSEDNSYDLSVSNPESYHVCANAIHVPAVLIQWLYNPDSVQSLMSHGFTEHESHSALDYAEGSLEEAFVYLKEKVGTNASFSSSESKETSPSSDDTRSRSLLYYQVEINTNESGDENTTNPSTSITSTIDTPLEKRGASLCCNETASSSLTRPEISLIELPDDENIIPQKRRIDEKMTPSVTPPLQSPRQEDHRVIATQKNDKGLTLDARDDEFDYTITFEKTPLGFEIHPCAHNVNGCVGKRLNNFSRENVYKGSLILACNDIWLLGQTTQYINQCIKAEIQHPPITMTFRAKVWMKSERARKLRKKIERSRSKSQITHEDRRIGRSSSPTSMNTRINSGRKRKPAADEVESLRVFVGGGTFEKGITHVNFEINGDEKETKIDPRRTTNPVYGETLIWKEFDAQEGNLLTCQAMNSESIFAIGAVRIPGDKTTLETVIAMKEENGNEIGSIQVNITYLR